MSHICAADDCNNPFDPVLPEQIYCSRRCSTRMRVRRLRARRKNGPGGGGGGKRRQLALFAKQPVSAKRVKQPRPETAPLFTMLANGKHEKHVPVPAPKSFARYLLSDIECRLGRSHGSKTDRQLCSEKYLICFPSVVLTSFRRPALSSIC